MLQENGIIRERSSVPILVYCRFIVISVDVDEVTRTCSTEMPKICLTLETAVSPLYSASTREQ